MSLIHLKVSLSIWIRISLSFIPLSGIVFVASQMTAAVFDTMAVKLSQNGVQFAANGSQVKFDGYLAIYNDSDKNKMLPDMAVGDVVKQVNSKPEQHFTQPPARYSEATLIKTLEENGVGRPSTYAPTIETIQKRYYVRLAAKRFEPTELGEIVNKLIVEYFPDIVNVTFTAEMEGKLMMSKLEKSSGNVSLMLFTNHSLKKSPRLKKKWRKSKSRMNQLDLTVKCVVVQWLLNLVVLVSSTLVAISQIAVIPKQS